MAKNLANLRRQYDWLKIELADLNNKYEAKKQNELNRFVEKANKKLLPLAYSACDKEQYALCEFEEKLMEYDVDNRLAIREVNHTAVKAIFKAVKSDADWSSALVKFSQERENLAAKRSAFVAQINSQKDKYLSSQKTGDLAAYEALKTETENEYNAFSAALDAKYSVKLEAESAKLTQKLQKLEVAIEKEKSAKTRQQILPEDVILSVKGLKMYFGGLKAVDDLDFEVKRGEIFGLIGPNGAGKTTVFNCITQFYKPTGGELLFTTKDDETITLTDYKVHDIVLKGIARTFQNVEVVKEVSVIDNLLIAATRQYSSSLFTQMFHLPKLKKEEKMLRAKADKVLEYMDLSAYRDRLCWGLPYGVLKKVEIARALMCDPQLIILDEPAAGLNESETAGLAKLINKIRQDLNCTILLVEHDMSLVMNVCDHICAISFGRKLAYGTPEDVQSSKAVQEAYLGVGGKE